MLFGVLQAYINVNSYVALGCYIMFHHHETLGLFFNAWSLLPSLNLQVVDCFSNGHYVV